MAIKKINEQPKITDTVLFEITTPDVYGCYLANPYKIDRVTIYFVERDFAGDNFGEYTKLVTPDNLIVKLTAAEKKFCNDPTPENSFEVQKIQSEIQSSSQKNVFYYKDRVTVKVIGTEAEPAWLSSVPEKSDLKHITSDDNGDTQYGRFTYEWTPEGNSREGDYFICWTWTPQSDGDKISAHLPFFMLGDPKAVISIPTHSDPDDKYETLLETYLPDMYKTTITDDDVTPQVTALLNKSVGKGFKFIEDMAAQIIDLFDANALHESLLVYQSNLFGLKLKSNDPTLWRRQIKTAVPLFKKKGTLEGLKDAFSQAGMTLENYQQYWQIVPPYTTVDSFLVADSPTFTLSKNVIITPINTDNFGLWLRRAGTSNDIELNSDYVSFEVTDRGDLTMTWIGDTLSSGGIDLFSGDRIRVMWQHREINSVNEQNTENYVRNLPLADQRDEDEQAYPPKNWNVRIISEEDPMFDVLVPVRHPFNEWVVFGQVRNEFAYSENIYNMDEYNSSVRPSIDPCMIDKSFIDPCGACLSSLYSVDIGVQELSNDRMVESLDILREYTPFHARLHSINFTGEINEFVPPPVEGIEFLVTLDHVQHVIAGEANPFFNRVMPDGLGNWAVTRNQLADKNTVLSGQTGTAYNRGVSFVSPDVSLADLGVFEGSHVLEILAPSANSGTYQINSIKGNSAHVISSVIEPVNETAFTFNLSNIIYGNSNTSIEQDDLFLFSDESKNFSVIGVKTQWDVVNTPNYSGGPWKIHIPSYRVAAFEIKDIRDGTLILDGDFTLPVVTTTGVNYSLIKDTGETIFVSSNGKINCQRRGLVDLNDQYLVDIENFIKIDDYIEINGTEYRISEFSGSTFWIDGYSDGSAAGITVATRRRLVKRKTGFFGYHGLKLVTSSDHESGFEMVNGNNPPIGPIKDNSHFKENFLFLIDGEYYKIAEIDGVNVILSGRDQIWTTENAGGTIVSYSLIHFPKKEVNIGFLVFDQLGRDGKDPIVREVESLVDNSTAIVALSTSGSSGMQENIAQEEGISFIIETRSGFQQKVVL